jgi:molybdopterin converting factor small subunit
LKVKVELFGRASSQTGEREIVLDLPQGSTLRDAALALVVRYPVLAWIPEASRPARNLEYAHWDDPLHEGDELSFIPPTSGG